MRILFIKPPLNPNLISVTRYEPLEFEYLAAGVKEHTVDIFDMRIEKNLMKKLDDFKPDLVGITAYTCDVKTVKRIFKEIKLYNNSIKTVIGGNHATFQPYDFAEGYVDVIFLGYSDHTLRDYINTIENSGDVTRINNLGLVEDNKIFFTEKKPHDVDLDSLPFPARHLTRKYQKKYHDSLRNRLALVMSSRGCPFRCTFCACWKLMDGRYVTRNALSVIEELKSLPEEIDIVYFSDDNTVHNIKRAWKFSKLIKENNIKKKLQMYARADTIVKNPELFRSLKEAGLEYLTVGFESFSDSELKNMNKMTTVKINSEAIRTLKKLGIYINAHFIVNPNYTEEDFSRLLKYVNEEGLFRPAYPVLTPLPGTQLYEETKDRFAINSYDFFDFAHSILHTKLTRKEFYSQLANLYNKSYSLKRYFKYLFNREQKYNTDGISLFMLLMVRLFAIQPFIKMKNAYKSEPIEKLD